MILQDKLIALIERSALLWSAEAEVFRSYWDFPGRSNESDRLWLLRQMHKELLDGVMPALHQVESGLAALDDGYVMSTLSNDLRMAQEEFEHFTYFAHVYSQLARADDPAPGPVALREFGWAENDALMALRKAHRQKYGELGFRATRFTEGGYCTLFSEGMKLRGRGGVNDEIASMCAKIYDDEFDHMLSGVADLSQASCDLNAGQWETLSVLVTAQLECRVYMRNAQFSSAVPPQRIDAMLRGECEPLEFDYERAFGV